MESAVLQELSEQPLVSVLIVNYNYERFLAAAIESVLQQTYQHFELVICDDGSKDNSRAVISRYAARDRRIRPIFKENAAVAAALNDAYRASTGQIIAMLDADDLFVPGKLTQVVARLRLGGRVGMVMDKLTKIDSDEAVIGCIPAFGTFDRGELRDPILATGGTFSAAPTSALSMRRECCERVFPIPEKQFRTEADAYMRTVAALYYAVEVIEEPLTIYRVHASNVTASKTVDLNWCERGIETGERIQSVLKEHARKSNWHVAPLTVNPSYCEMLLVRDYLRGAPAAEIAGHIRQLHRAARSVQTDDRLKIRMKAAALSIGAALPRALRVKLLETIYLPGGLKRALGRHTRTTQQRSERN